MGNTGNAGCPLAECLLILGFKGAARPFIRCGEQRTMQGGVIGQPRIGDDQRDEATFVSLAPDWIIELAIGLRLLEEPACNCLSFDVVQNVGHAMTSGSLSPTLGGLEALVAQRNSFWIEFTYAVRWAPCRTGPFGRLPSRRTSTV